MPCKDGPISNDYLDKRDSQIEALRLRKWLDDKLGYVDQDETAKLCAKIKSLDNQAFWGLVAQYIQTEEEARDIVAWWQKHKATDWELRNNE